VEAVCRKVLTEGLNELRSALHIISQGNVAVLRLHCELDDQRTAVLARGKTHPSALTLSLLMSYLCGAPSKARNLTYIYIYMD
jgi:hypothetical protein